MKKSNEEDVAAPKHECHFITARIHHIDSGTQERMIDDIDSLLKDKSERFKLLVVDSPVTHYRCEYIGRAMLPERQQKLYKFMRRLVTIAHTYNIVVVVTNHINTTPNSRKMSGRPAGGNVMGHAATYSIRLWTLNQAIYHATIVNSPYHPSNSTAFYISEKGLVDDNPSADDLPDGDLYLDFDWESFLGM